MAESPRPRRSAGTWFQSLYVRVLLRLLPHLINVFKHVSPKIRAEVDYLEPGYTFMLSVNGTDLACACRRTASGSFKRVPPAAIASDVEPGSGLASADAQAFTVDYVIAFRSLPDRARLLHRRRDAEGGARAACVLHARAQQHGRGPHLYASRRC